MNECVRASARVCDVGTRKRVGTSESEGEREQSVKTSKDLRRALGMFMKGEKFHQGPKFK